MPLTCAQIKDLSNPFQYLGSGDALAEHRDELNKLTASEMTALASVMILTCPEEKLTHFGLELNALKHPEQGDSCAHTILSGAWRVRKSIHSIVDPNNKKPYATLLSDDFSADLFAPYGVLTRTLMPAYESTLVSRLVLATPAERRSLVAQKISSLFPSSSFATEIGAAFSIRRCVDAYLLGDNPEGFFSSHEVTKELCSKHQALFDHLSIAIAQNIVLTADDDDIQALKEHIQCFFPDSTLQTELHTAFELSDRLSTLLDNNNPDYFFSDPSFNPHTCQKFTELFTAFAKEHPGIEQRIATQLSRLDGTRYKLIIEQVDLLKDIPLFRKIEVQLTQNTTQAQPKNPEHFFKPFRGSSRDEEAIVDDEEVEALSPRNKQEW